MTDRNDGRSPSRLLAPFGAENSVSPMTTRNPLLWSLSFPLRWTKILSVVLFRTRSSYMNGFISRWEPRWNTTITPGLSTNRARACNGMSPTTKWFGSPSQELFEPHRDLTAISSNRTRPTACSLNTFQSETLIAYELGYRARA